MPSAKALKETTLVYVEDSQIKFLACKDEEELLTAVAAHSGDTVPAIPLYGYATWLELTIESVEQVTNYISHDVSKGS